MSLNKNKVLRAERLFQYRRQQDKTVPQRGGAKEYSPDGSWLQNKRIETFHDERTAILAEQRVEKMGSIVQATWNPTQGLVEFIQEVGKFWSHMGFVDQSRKWLYPEEALFLMETCVLEVKYGGVPLSIQEAYARLLGNDVSLEEYQTYAHLRRLGYVVLRHLGSSGISEYERKIKLDQHIKDPKKRHRHQKDGKSSDDESPDEVTMKKAKTTDQSKCEELRVSERLGEPVIAESLESDSVVKPALVTSWNLPSRHKEHVTPKHCDWDFESILFPNIGNTDTVILKIPEAKYIPPNIDLTEELEDICLFEVQDYRQQQMEIGRTRQRHQESDSYLFDLEFSYSDWARSHRKIDARNWTEYKEKLNESKLPSNVRPSPVSHLWQGEVTPLIKPQDATSTGDLLSKLQVIQSVSTQPSQLKDPKIKFSFDVHLPNAKFKKTQPGLPNHRVCVVRSQDPPPTLADITGVVSRFNDNLPVNWAVVDSGDVAFYNMSSVILPVDISMG